MYFLRVCWTSATFKRIMIYDEIQALHASNNSPSFPQCNLSLLNIVDDDVKGFIFLAVYASNQFLQWRTEKKVRRKMSQCKFTCYDVVAAHRRFKNTRVRYPDEKFHPISISGSRQVANNSTDTARSFCSPQFLSFSLSYVAPFTGERICRHPYNMCTGQAPNSIKSLLLPGRARSISPAVAWDRRSHCYTYGAPVHGATRNLFS